MFSFQSFLAVAAICALAVPAAPLQRRAPGTVICETQFVGFTIDLRFVKGSAGISDREFCVGVTHSGTAPLVKYTPGDLVVSLSETKEDPPKTGPLGATCEHIVEVQLLKAIFTDAVCEAIAAELKKPGTTLSKSALKKKFETLAELFNGPQNLIFAENSIENPKGTMVNLALKEGAPLAKPETDDKKAIETVAINDYMNAKFGQKSLAFAKEVDALLKSEFPGLISNAVFKKFGLANRWGKVLKFVKDSAANAKTVATALHAAANAPADDPPCRRGSAGCKTRKPATSKSSSSKAKAVPKKKASKSSVRR